MQAAMLWYCWGTWHYDRARELTSYELGGEELLDIVDRVESLLEGPVWKIISNDGVGAHKVAGGESLTLDSTVCVTDGDPAVRLDPVLFLSPMVKQSFYWISRQCWFQGSFPGKTPVERQDSSGSFP